MLRRHCDSGSSCDYFIARFIKSVKFKMKLPLWICHQKPNRCFSFNGKPISLCARCFGLYLFIIIGILIAFIFDINQYLSAKILFTATVLATLPLFIDSTTQFLKIRESNNWLRFFTGALAGILCGIDINYIAFNL